MSTEEGNHKIAIFNGVEFIEGDTMHQCDRHQYLLPDESCTCYKKYNAYIIGGKRLQAEDLQYHTSWDWLMPVLKKVKPELKKILGEITDRFLKGEKELSKKRDELLLIIERYDWIVDHFDINVAFSVAVESIRFLTWYNAQSPKK